MTIEEMVQRTLFEHARDVAGGSDPGRASAARRQAREIRARRGAGVVVGLAAVASLAGWVGNELVRAEEPVRPAQPPERIIEVVDTFAGRTLITSAETTYRQALEMTVDATAGSEWLVTCAGVGPEHVVHRTIDGTAEDTAVCGPVEVLGETMSFRWTAAEPAGKGRELRLWITRDGEVVEPEGAVLAAAVYALPAPVENLAGSDILEVEPVDGQDWVYVDSVDSRPGERRLTHRFGALASEALLEITSGGSGRGSVELVVDGEPVEDPDAYAFGSTDLGNRLAPGEPHTVTLRIVGDVPADARLAIVRRVAADAGPDS